MLAQPLRHEDIVGVYAGLRPLLQGESDATSQLSREHAVSQSVTRLSTVAGGKYTNYRVMAKDIIDVAGVPTRAGSLTSPLRDRFGIVLRLDFYMLKDLAHIVQRSADILNVPIDASGAAEASVHVQGRLDIEASGSADVNYAGSPVMQNVDVSGAASVRRL